jgi:hypothetical protein
MTTGAATQPPPAQLADEAVRQILQTQWDGVTAVRVDSPPGAGKTGVVERLAVQSLGLLHERCMVATQTNEQAFDLARRFARGFPRLPFTLFVRDGLVVPADVSALPNVRMARTSADVPHGPCVVIANAWRWSWVDRSIVAPFDLQLIDEAFQLSDFRFHQIASLARRVVLVGDPGQIAPVVTVEVERWRADPAGPHVASPRALLARHPTGIRLMSLPVSRRLTPDTVRFVQPAFYRTLPFTALAAPGERALTTSVAGTTPLDRTLDLISGGASLVCAELPPLITGEVDEELADTIVALIARLMQRGATIRDGDAELPLTPDMIGVVCAHVSQVNAVRERLPAAVSGVFVETADRFQGLERPLMIVHHPLSGRVDATAFHLDAGRLCVMLSRHRVACVLVSRAGVDDLLLRYAPGGDRVLDMEQDLEFEGWRAHLSLFEMLRRYCRIVRLST